MNAWIYIRLFSTLAIAGWFFLLSLRAIKSGVAHAAGRNYHRRNSAPMFWTTAAVQFLFAALFFFTAVSIYLKDYSPLPAK